MTQVQSGSMHIISGEFWSLSTWRSWCDKSRRSRHFAFICIGNDRTIFQLIKLPAENGAPWLRESFFDRIQSPFECVFSIIYVILYMHLVRHVDKQCRIPIYMCNAVCDSVGTAEIQRRMMRMEVVVRSQCCWQYKCKYAHAFCRRGHRTGDLPVEFIAYTHEYQHSRCRDPAKSKTQTHSFSLEHIS